VHGPASERQYRHAVRDETARLDSALVLHIHGQAAGMTPAVTAGLPRTQRMPK
jgi:hypothetical protein